MEWRDIWQQSGAFRSGKKINKIYTKDQLQDQIAKFNGDIKNTITSKF